MTWLVITKFDDGYSVIEFDNKPEAQTEFEKDKVHCATRAVVLAEVVEAEGEI